jgi:hypothetical protein
MNDESRKSFWLELQLNWKSLCWYFTHKNIFYKYLLISPKKVSFNNLFSSNHKIIYFLDLSVYEDDEDEEINRWRRWRKGVLMEVENNMIKNEKNTIQLDHNKIGTPH